MTPNIHLVDGAPRGHRVAGGRTPAAVANEREINVGGVPRADRNRPGCVPSRVSNLDEWQVGGVLRRARPLS